MPTPKFAAPDHQNGGPTQDRTRVGDTNNAAAMVEIERLSTWLDSKFRIPGTNIRFGTDAVAGIIPGLGDSAGIIASAVVIARAVRLGARGWTLVRMVVLAIVDAVFGLIPIAGTVFDVAFKANQRNVALLRRHVTDAEQTAVSARRSIIVVGVVMGVAMVLVAVGAIALTYWALTSI